MTFGHRAHHRTSWPSALPGGVRVFRSVVQECSLQTRNEVFGWSWRPSRPRLQVRTAARRRRANRLPQRAFPSNAQTAWSSRSLPVWKSQQTPSFCGAELQLGGCGLLFKYTSICPASRRALSNVVRRTQSRGGDFVVVAIWQEKSMKYYP